MTAVPTFDVGDVFVEDADGTLIEITDVHQSYRTVWYKVAEEDREGRTIQNQYQEDTLTECFTFISRWSDSDDCDRDTENGEFCFCMVETGVHR